MKTYSAKASEIEKKWVVIDANGLVVGRLASLVAMRLRGKHKPGFTPHMDCGDNVIIVNAAKVLLTGDKLNKKIYYRHSGFPGGLYQRTLSEQRAYEPTSIIYKAVRGMLPNNKLREGRLARLKIFEGAEHNHAAQKPVKLSLKGTK